ncbi:hypothetical protein CMU94_01910 [Elizabethkingia anophelis]|nr:hypothetical protein [Elizabethkingia anophelis]
MTKKYIKDLSENDVIHAPTLEIAENICKKLHELGYKWNSGADYSDCKWNEYKEDTCYCPKTGFYADKNFFINNGCFNIYYHEIIEDFIHNKSPQPHYDNSERSFRSLMELGQKLELNHYEQDILKRLVRCRKKGQFKQDLQKIKDTIDIYLNEYDDERNGN